MSRYRTSKYGMALVILLLSVSGGVGQDRQQQRPEPTHRNVFYGPHERNVVDFYQAESDRPTPVLVYFHGGGFRGGDKGRIDAMLYRLCMDAGISFAAANYRLSQQAPYPAQMHDSARAIQFLRSKAPVWNIDADRVAAFGGSAGAGISLWLAFHDDLADPESEDLVDRQSTRLACAVGLQAQSTYDPREIKNVVPGNAYDHPALKQLFGVGPGRDWDRDPVDEALSANMKDASPIQHLTPDDPPVFVYHRKRQEVPGDIHHANFGRYLKEKMEALGITCIHRLSTDFRDERQRNEAIFEFIRSHLGQDPQRLHLELRSRPKHEAPAESATVSRSVAWDPEETAVIICDMWDDHTCQGAAARVAELAPAIDRAVGAARAKGVFIIHAPSDRTSFYEGTPQRRRAIEAPFVEAPVEIKWNHWDPELEGSPLDFLHGGGCGCDEPCPGWVADQTGRRRWKGGKLPWTRQIESIEIAPADAVSEDGQEIYNLLRQRDIKNVILMGVHTNICVSGRPFGLRQMVYLGMNVVLCRDLTDSFFQPKSSNFNHFRGTDLVVEHIEKHLCPTITSVSLTGQEAFQFREDTRPHTIVIRVEAGPRDRIDAAVSIPLEEAGDSGTAFQLVHRTEEGTVPVSTQIDPGPPARLWWFMPGRTRAGEARTFELRSVEDASAPRRGTQVGVHQTNHALTIRIEDQSVARYNSGHVDAPPGVDPSYGRSAHLHPVWTPSSRLVTDQFPPDHLHQSGIFLAYTKTEFDGRTPNFWELKGGTGRVRHQQTLGTSSGPIFGGFRVEHEHVDLSAKEPTAALRETWDVRVWNSPEPDVPYWIMDIVSTLRCATDKPLTVKEYHYGGMAIRGARSWKAEVCQFLTSNGKTRATGNHTRAKWVDIGGPIAGEQAGVTVMTHPDNLRFPEPIRIHPTMPYMVFTPAVLGDWTIQPGKDHVTRYRYVVHDGQVDPSVADRLWYDYAHPCRVTRNP